MPGQVPLSSYALDTSCPVLSYELSGSRYGMLVPVMSSAEILHATEVGTTRSSVCGTERAWRYERVRGTAIAHGGPIAYGGTVCGTATAHVVRVRAVLSQHVVVPVCGTETAHGGTSGRSSWGHATE
eukprot:2688491-Rhodomonas_salina.1